MKWSLSNEAELIEYFRQHSHPVPGDVILGIGDDAAVVRVSGKERLLWTTDLLIERIHFRTDWMSLEQIGRKAIRVNLSDIAAMGGIPKFTLVSLGIPQKTSFKSVQKLWKGIRSASREAGVAIIGGDTNASPQWVIHVVLWGETRGQKFLERKGARDGDFLYVTGTLGGSRLGFEALKRNKRRGFESFIRIHAEPPNRLAVGQYLVTQKSVHSLTDLSDGLTVGLQSLLTEGRNVSAEIWVDDIPCEPSLKRKAADLGLNAQTLLIEGGEDYELLFTAATSLPPKIKNVAVTKIGRILSKKRSKKR